jgi:hypothetical protein
MLSNQQAATYYITNELGLFWQQVSPKVVLGFAAQFFCRKCKNGSNQNLIQSNIALKKLYRLRSKRELRKKE